jgi:hypothetical protein
LLQATAENATQSSRVFAGMQITIKREMKALGGDMDANTDGEVLVVLDLRPDAALLTKRTARELVNRFQKLRKKAGLQPGDAVALYYAPACAATAAPVNGEAATAAAALEELQGALSAEATYLQVRMRTPHVNSVHAPEWPFASSVHAWPRTTACLRPPACSRTRLAHTARASCTRADMRTRRTMRRCALALSCALLVLPRAGLLGLMGAGDCIAGARSSVFTASGQSVVVEHHRA